MIKPTVYSGFLVYGQSYTGITFAVLAEKFIAQGSVEAPSQSFSGWMAKSALPI